ncbi:MULTISPECIES: phage tail tube protein [unclassified Streptomyces]|uniref:phage tail tube protein n=1 Tax=unclassified Streptomyces TaxID=2593676 RepID=UPI0022AE9214|nr:MULTISPECIES: hypothetical protein [unclassified Streptomyces]MCZ4097313.1 hypothetical protein [Streptomyces sp. H39-C1]MCZ4120617.1 hypothetical protein [Streptomyces sp. H39-S7]
MAAVGNDAKQIRFAPHGALYVHFGALAVDALPQGVDDDLKTAGFIALGYCSEDGTEITPKIETDELAVWQSSVPVLRYVKSAAFQVKSTLMQGNDVTTRLFYGSEWVKVTPKKPGDREQYRLDISSNPDLAEVSLVVDWSDDAAKYRAVVGRAMVSDRGSISLTRTKNQTFELTLDALDSDGTLGYLLTDDPSIAPITALPLFADSVDAGTTMRKSPAVSAPPDA